MKKLFLLSIVFVIGLVSNILFAQGAYFQVNTGYGLKTSSQNLMYLNFYNSTSTTDYSSKEQVMVSLGKGFNFGGAFGYMFNKNLGAELGVSYLMGDKGETKFEHSKYSRESVDHILYSRMLQFNPALLIESGLEKFDLYAKFGLILGMGYFMYEFEVNDDDDVTIWKTRYDGGLAVGFSTGIGASFRFNERLSLFGELNLVSLSYSPTRGKLTEATHNGTNMLPDLSVRSKETEYVDSFTVEKHITPPEDEPRKELTQKFPFSSIGSYIGLKIDLKACK